MEYNIPIRYWYMDKNLDSSDMATVQKMYELQKQIAFDSINFNIDFERDIVKKLEKMIEKEFNKTITIKI